MKLKVILNGGDWLPLSLGEGFSIGRERGDLTIPQDKKLSRRHCSIWQYPDRYFVIDHESRNGTYINGRRMIPNTMVPVKEGDVVRFGSQHLSVRNIDPQTGAFHTQPQLFLKRHLAKLKIFDRKHLDKMGYVFSLLFFFIGLGFKLNRMYIEHKIASNPVANFNRELHRTHEWSPEIKSKMVSYFIDRSAKNLEFADLDVAARQRLFDCYAEGISSQYDSPAHFADEMKSKRDDTNQILQQIGSACVNSQHLAQQENAEDILSSEERTPANNAAEAHELEKPGSSSR